VFVNTCQGRLGDSGGLGGDRALISYTAAGLAAGARERLKEVFRQLSGIGGGRSLGFGPNRVRSLPDGVAQAIEEYLKNSAVDEEELGGEPEGGPEAGLEAEQLALRIGDLCPECGEAAVVNEEGCRKCYACAYSEC
jgi:ribonucleoside-diphosphate reductase alpha chain